MMPGFNSAIGQVVPPPSGGVLDRFIAPPGALERDFLGKWNLVWDDLGDPACPCRATLTIEVAQNGELKGYWPMKGATAVLQGGVAYDQNVWAGRFAQPDDGVDFPVKGHFRLETRGGTALTGSFQRDGMAIPYRWSATRQ